MNIFPMQWSIIKFLFIFTEILQWYKIMRRAEESVNRFKLWCLEIFGTVTFFVCHIFRDWTAPQSDIALSIKFWYNTHNTYSIIHIHKMNPEVFTQTTETQTHWLTTVASREVAGETERWLSVDTTTNSIIIYGVSHGKSHVTCSQSLPTVFLMSVRVQSNYLLRMLD